MEYPGLMVSVSGVRGRVGEALTPEIITKFAAGFGAWALSKQHTEKTIVLGRDSRVSGPMFHHAVIAALQSVGARIVDVGIAPTPTIQLAVEHHHAAGGLAITASHNPIEWNALKFIGPSGLFLDAAEGEEMRAMVESAVSTRSVGMALGTVRVRRWSDRATTSIWSWRSHSSTCRGFADVISTSRWTACVVLGGYACLSCSTGLGALSTRSIWRSMDASLAPPNQWRRTSVKLKRWCDGLAP